MGLLDAFDLLNWVDKLWGVLFGLRSYKKRKPTTKKGVYQFLVSRDLDFSGSEIEALLGRYGIPVGGRSVTDANFGFLVNASQARFAEYLLRRRGIVHEGKLVDPNNEKITAERGMPPSWADKRRQKRRGWF